MIFAPCAPGRSTVVDNQVSESCRVPLLASTECRANHVVPRNPGKYYRGFPSRAKTERNVASLSRASIAIGAVAIAKPAQLVSSWHGSFRHRRVPRRRACRSLAFSYRTLSLSLSCIMILDPTETLSWGTASWRDVLAVNSILVVQIAIIVHFACLDKTRTNHQVV
jgi:hypothetical protein